MVHIFEYIMSTHIRISIRTHILYICIYMYINNAYLYVHISLSQTYVGIICTYVYMHMCIISIFFLIYTHVSIKITCLCV